MYTVGPTLPDTFGASSPKGNYADMSTYGYEISLGYNDSFRLAGKPFNFGIKATLADYHSVIDLSLIHICKGCANITHRHCISCLDGNRGSGNRTGRYSVFP